VGAPKLATCCDVKRWIGRWLCGCSHKQYLLGGNFVTLDIVGLVELLMFDAWCNTPVFGGMIFLLDIVTHRNMFQKRDIEHMVQM